MEEVRSIMHVDTSITAAPTPPTGPTVPNSPTLPPTPIHWRLAILAAIGVIGALAYGLRDVIGLRGQAFAGVIFFFGIVAAFSQNLRAVKWSTIYWGVSLQVILALLVLQVPAVYQAFEVMGVGVKKFIGYSDEGARFVFGNLSDNRPPALSKESIYAPPTLIALGASTHGPMPAIALTAAIKHAAIGKESTETNTWMRLFQFPAYNDKGEEVRHNGFMFQFAFIALPPILFVSAFFTVLYHFGILQFIVRLMARGMVHLLGTSGAETLSVAANVFMGQTEAPLIVKPYVPRMTNSELFTLMTSGMAHISGGMMVVYINYGANPVAVITTCVMACPASLYLAKLFMPETTTPETSGSVHMPASKSPYANAIDAAASGTADGLRLALNVAAMLIVFIAFVAMFNGLLGVVSPGLSLEKIFGWIFSPVAFLMGVDINDADKVGSLLGSKLTINEHYAYLRMKDWKMTPNYLDDRSYRLAAFALTGFANFSSIGIQLGGIGALAPDRRHDLARLGGRALFVGFTATLLNAAIAGVIL
jgi:nucleoside transporter